MTQYQIFIVKSNSKELEPAKIQSSLEDIPRMGDYNYIVEPSAKSNRGNKAIKVETKIDNYIMSPSTPDYGIFEITAKEWDKESGVVIVKTSTMSVSSSANIAYAIEQAMNLEGVEMFFLAKWLDRPDQFTTLSNETPPSGESFKIVRTWNAHGFQALVFSSSGFNKLLGLYDPDKNPVVCRPFSQVINNLLQKGKLYGATTTPSLMQYDSTLVTAINDLSASAVSGSPAIHSYLRTSECRGATLPEKPLNRRISNDISFFWLFLIACIVIFCMWILLKVGRIDNGNTPLGTSFEKKA